MNREIFKNIIFGLFIILSQILIFNHINLFGISSPSIYVILFILYKTNYDKTLLIILGFIIGLIIDLSMQTYGCHAFASLTVCFLREWIEKYSFGVNSNLPNAMVKGTSLTNRLTYFIIITILHSLLYFILLYFNSELLLRIILSTLYNSIITFIIVWIISELIFEK
ncbi:MAG: rod shape-determining protein MreD [Bacteroidota bacterium]